MRQCPDCRAENAPDARFCAECGARFSETPPAPQDQPLPAVPTPASGGAARSTGRETIVLRQLDTPPIERLPDLPPSGVRPATDATIDTPPTERLPDLSPPGVRPATDATIVAPSGPSAPIPPVRAASMPTAALPAVPPAGYGGGMPTQPPLALAQPPARSGSRRIWLVLGLVVLLALGMLGALVVGVLLIVRNAGPAPAPTPAVGGGLARFTTVAAGPTAAPRPTAAAGNGKILLEDDFDDPSRSSLTPDKTANATYAFADGGYTIAVHPAKFIVWSSLDSDYGDGAIEVDTTFERGPAESAAGLFFHYQDKHNFYFFSIAGDGSYSLDLYKNDEWQTLIDWTDSPGIKGQGEVNRLRVETAGDTIRLFVNGKLLDEVSDDTFNKGTIALAVNTFSEGDATFLFDNLIVRGP
jgi:hypothetical protein